jgi:hypothetical protein
MTSSISPKINFRQAWQRLLRTSPSLRAAFTGEQISKQLWAKKVHNFESLPEAFQPVLNDLIKDKTSFPYTVLTPTFEGYLEQENEKLALCLDHRLIILEKDLQEVAITSYRLENIYRIEFGKILLKAWIHICGTDDQGQFSISKLRFNSVTDYLFKPFIEAGRDLDEPVEPVDMQVEREKFSPLKWKHFKFMNYACISLLPCEHVQQYIFQPEMETDHTRLFGLTLFKRTTCLSHILILTDRELISIRDDETSQHLKDRSRYGGIRNYVSLNHLQDLIIKDAPYGMVNLIVILPSGDKICMSFDKERVPELEQFVEKVKARTTHPIS